VLSLGEEALPTLGFIILSGGKPTLYRRMVRRSQCSSLVGSCFTTGKIPSPSLKTGFFRQVMELKIQRKKVQAVLSV
jgi:hypothetical protein